MAALNFPSNPTTGDIYDDYRWDGEAWINNSTGEGYICKIVTDEQVAINNGDGILGFSWSTESEKFNWPSALVKSSYEMQNTLGRSILVSEYIMASLDLMSLEVDGDFLFELWHYVYNASDGVEKETLMDRQTISAGSLGTQSYYNLHKTLQGYDTYELQDDWYTSVQLTITNSGGITDTIMVDWYHEFKINI